MGDFYSAGDSKSPAEWQLATPMLLPDWFFDPFHVALLIADKSYFALLGCKPMVNTDRIANSKSFMSDKELFLKNGFSPAETDGTGNDLLVYKLKDGPAPVINDFNKQLNKCQGLHILYSKQCPWVARLIEEIKETGMAKQLDLQITELTTPEEAQQAPSLYLAFNLIFNGKLLADRYISLTRFNNILKKEKLI